MRKSWVAVGGWALVAFCCGCESTAMTKTTKPVVDPIRKTTNAVFKERKVGSQDTAQAVLFPREQEKETKQFKLKF